MTAEAVGRLGEVARFRSGWGGDTANFLMAAARLGGRCGYITRVGQDDFGEAFTALLRRHEIDASQVKSDAAHHTGLYFVSYAEDRQHRFAYFRRDSAASHLAPEDIDSSYVARARILHASGISQAISPSCAAAVDAAMAIARDAGVTISYDANVRPALGTIEGLTRSFERTLSQADIVFVSLEDVAHLYGDMSIDAALDRVLSDGPRLAVAKLGARGCLVRGEDGDCRLVPGWTVDAVDATGAGDAFDAGFVLALGRGESPEEAARYANAVGALTSTGVGAIAPQPTHEEVIALMRRQGEESTTSDGAS